MPVSRVKISGKTTLLRVVFSHPTKIKLSRIQIIYLVSKYIRPLQKKNLKGRQESIKFDFSIFCIIYYSVERLNQHIKRYKLIFFKLYLIFKYDRHRN